MAYASNRTHFTTADVLEQAIALYDWQTTKHHGNRVGKILRTHGFSQNSYKGRSVWFNPIPPKPQPEEEPGQADAAWQGRESVH
jgi:hypothetical protein